jgi:hypothetical protein
MTTLAITIELDTPDPIAAPDGYPQAFLSNLALADISGRICGLVTISGLGLGFEATEEGEGAVIEDPAGRFEAFGDWVEDPDLSEVLNADLDPYVYVAYLNRLIDAVEALYSSLACSALDQASATLCGALNAPAAQVS